ncbi:class I SAM-dependent methyltransferase [Methanococcoides sp. SA1]|nr:class I SAM-dependent methyltransferase [Methanococcoides sp. SA1]
MQSEYWKEHWTSNSEEQENIHCISGWGNRTFQEIMDSIVDTAEKLKLGPNDQLLDIGCGAGVFEMALTHWIKSIVGIDYSEGMVSVAQKHTDKYENVSIGRADIRKLPYENNSFDKILVNSVIQYLNDLKDVEIALKELNRVAIDNCIILIALLPDIDTKNKLLKGYYDLDLSSEVIEQKIEAWEHVIWFDKIQLQKIAENCGFRVIGITRPINDFQKQYYFDILLTKYKSD